MEELDCVVIGAGLYGLAAARHYTSLNPGNPVAILEGEATLGGSWAARRLYSGLKSNNLIGTYEYPDFPMDPETVGVKIGQHIPGGVIHDYLEAYARAFDIFQLIRFNKKVTVATHQDTVKGGWQLVVRDELTGQETTLLARRLVFATGVTSEPRVVEFKGQETFEGRIFHGKDLARNNDTMKEGKTVTVLGGGKSAWDAVYIYATAGVKVNWVIRESGLGPCWMAPPHVTPFKRWIEKLANTRFLTWFSPCIWGNADGYTTIRSLLHGSSLGRIIVDTFWKVLGNDVITLNRYGSHPDTAKLKPWQDAMFAGTSFGILNYDTDFFDVVKSDLVQVYIGEIDRLSPRKVHLADGTELVSDDITVHIGWKHKPPVKFLPEVIEQELGLPIANEMSEIYLASQQSLFDKADMEITNEFPGLESKQKSDLNLRANDLTEYMLHRFIVPDTERFLQNRDIAFVGLVANFSNPITAHIQGLWVAAYLSGRLARDPSAALGSDDAMAQLHHETALHNRFGKWRYPADWGTTRTPSFIFDAVPYFDLLLRDLDLAWRRKGGVLREAWSAYGPEDYRDVSEEWKKKYVHGQ